jgi:outer membrane protein assembly factor BamB
VKISFRRSAALLLLLTLSAGLSGCDWFEDIWWGSNKKPLPGKRVSVLLHQQTLNPDPAASEKEILLPPPDPNDEWPQAGGFPNHAMHHMVVGDGLRKAWSSGIGTKSSDLRRLMAQPVIAGGYVFTMDVEARVSAFDARNGSRLWRVDLTPDDEDDDHMGGGIAYANGRIFATTGFGLVYALDASNGKTIWKQHLPGPMRAPPTVAAGRVFAVTMENLTVALDAEDGHQLWTHSGVAELATVLGGANPAASQGTLVVPYSSGELFALKIETGGVLWSESLAAGRRTDAVSSLSDIRGRPVVDRGRVYAIGNGNMMVAIDLRTGRRLWEVEIGSLQSPWVAGDFLFIITNDLEVACVEAKTGKIRWVTPLQRWKDEEKKKGPLQWTAPVLVSDRIVTVGSHGWALALSPYTGQPIGVEEMSSGVTVTPSVAGGTLYFITEDGDLVAYR